MKNFNFKTALLSIGATISAFALSGQQCAQFDYFYSDINYPGGVKQSDLYTVSLEDGVATLNPILSAQDLPYGAHIAFNEENGLLYLVDDATGNIQTLDPITGEFGEVLTPESSIGGGVVQAAFNQDGKLLLGRMGNNTVYETDLSTNPYGLDIYDSQADISGGDMTFTDELPLLASKPNGNLYINAGEDFPNILLGNVDGEVTGMATFEDGASIVISSRNNDSFLVYSVSMMNGVEQTDAFVAELNGEPFTLENGDMASGCSESGSSILDCQDFRTYYIHDAQGGGPDILYGVELLEGGGTNLTEITTLPGGSHLGLGEDGLLYIVRYGTGMLTILDPVTLTSEQVQIQEGGNNITAIPAVVVGDDGLVYIGASNDKVYSVDPATGNATFIADANVGGGDLIFIEDQLWLANRGLGRFFEVGGDGEFDVAASEINGVSVLPDGNLLISNGNLASLFEVYEPFTGNATGETFNTGLTLFNGDLASRCFDNNLEACENYQVYLANSSNGGLYRITLDSENSSASAELLEDGFGGFHIALNGETGEVYIVKGSGEVAIYDPALDSTSPFSNIEMNGSNINSTYAAVYTSDGKLLVGSANQGKVYEVDPATGEASNPVDAPVNGGDLIETNDGNIWLINRNQNRFYDLDDQATFFDVSFNEIYGAAVLEDGLILVGDAGNQLKVVDPSIPGETEQVYNLEFSLSAGDLAAGCVEGGDIEIPCEGPWRTQTQGGWGAPANGNNPGVYRDANFANAFPEGLSIGCEDGFTLMLTSASAVQEFLPSGGAPSVFSENLVDPTGNEGSFAGNLTALALSLGFDAYDPDFGESEYPLADLYIQEGDFAGFTVGELFAIANDVIGGCNEEYSPSDINDAVDGVNNSYTDGDDQETGFLGCEEPEIETPNPFCTNETVYVDESDNIIRLTAMGWILDCEGNYGMRWRIRNGSDEAIEAFYNFAGAPALQGPFELEAGEAVYFTSGIFDNNDFSMTMRVFVDGEQVQVKAHGGNTTDLDSCLPEGCPDNDEDDEENNLIISDSQLSAYPNPSNGQTVVQFSVANNGRTTVEVLNMNGRVVKALFNQEAQIGNTYRVDLNGLDLPNGIYLTRMVNDGEITIEKIMIAR